MTSLQETLSQAVQTLLKPLVRILLRNGIAYGSFAEMARKVYVDVAWKEFAPEGKKQTITRVSALTGLTRKEAKRLHELGDTNTSQNEQRYNRAVRVISGWVNDARFQDGRGEPATLPLEGDEASFARLVHDYSGDMTPRAMLSVLENAGTVKVQDKQVHLLRRAYLPGQDPEEKITILGTDSAELIATIDHNLTAPAEDLRFQRKVSNLRLRADAVPVFRAMATEQSQQLLERFDAWLAAHEADQEDGRYVSVGIYYFQQDSDEDTAS
ncbi:MAG TPA: hypothetical protein ENJ79_05360 [Gammaproteobacteria bacterium]|nr:hypothetical protein [Gammaproteobacteria bacterium]